VRILYHHRTLGDGAEGIHIREVVKAFRDLGHEVKVIGPAGEALPEPSAGSRRLGLLKRTIPSGLYELLEIAYTAYGFWRTTREIRSFRPDFVYDRYITFNAGPVLAGIACRVPVCLEVNAPLALERSTQRDERLMFRAIAARMERWICSNATRTVVVSTPLREYLESVGVPEGKCLVMPNGVDPIRFSPRERDRALMDQVGVTPDDFVVGFTGVLRAWHGLELLVAAMAKLAAAGLKTFLLIVGEGPYRQQLEALVANAGLKGSVRITGHVRHERVPDYVALFDVAVSPRATFYASPMKVIEYMALGKPVVVPRTPNFLDIVDDCVNGVTFEEGSAPALKEAIAYLYKSRDICLQLGRHARRKVEDRLNWRWNALRCCELMRPELDEGR
jgi:glycosyltransferase involved in cell wall biosynthesis